MAKKKKERKGKRAHQLARQECLKRARKAREAAAAEPESEPEPEPELLRTCMAGGFFSSLCGRRAPSFEHPLAGPATAHKGLALQLSRATSNGLATLFCSALLCALTAAVLCQGSLLLAPTQRRRSSIKSCWLRYGLRFRSSSKSSKRCAQRSTAGARTWSNGYESCTSAPSCTEKPTAGWLR